MNAEFEVNDSGHGQEYGLGTSPIMDFQQQINLARGSFPPKNDPTVQATASFLKGYIRGPPVNLGSQWEKNHHYLLSTSLDAN